MEFNLCFLSLLCVLSVILAAPWNIISKNNNEIDLEETDPELIGGFFEGDMEFDMFRNGLINATARWPNNVVYYKIDEMFDMFHVLYIRGAMSAIESVSCLRFHPVPENISTYVHIVGENTGCHSKVGYQGNIQTMNLRMDQLDTGCFKFGTIVHELLHTLGFYHQQSAADRDEYVQIVYDNIIPEKFRNFNKYDSNIVTDFGIRYDYYSVMHYSSYAFSRNGKKTIVPLIGTDMPIGQRVAMSPGDIAKLNVMYNCWLPMKPIQIRV